MRTGSLIPLAALAKRSLLIVLPAAILLAYGSLDAAAQTLTSDQMDYPPGTTATLTGTGFARGELVMMQIDATPDAGQDTWSWAVVADESGGFVTTWEVCAECVGATLRATADGVTSGSHAECSFTDAAAWTLTIAPTSSVIGQTQTYVLTAHNISTGGGNQMGCITITIPASFTPSGSPSVVPGSTTHSWTVSRSGQVVTATAISNGDRLNNGESIQFSMAATAPGTTAGSPFTWTGVARTNTNCTGASVGNPDGGQPTVSVTCAPAGITCPGNITVNNAPGLCSAIVSFSASATGSPSPSVTYSQNPGTSFPVGTTVVTATATNACGSANCSFTVTVVDNTPPVITLAGATPVTVECHTSFSDPGASATDNCPGSIPVTVSGSVNVNAVGTYILTYSATDAHGNTATATRTVNVVDTTKPSITLVGGELTLECHGPAFSDPGASASDACAGSLTVSVSGSIDVNTVGDYVLVYSASDPSGNSDSKSRTVHVVDTTNPVVALVGGDMTLECHGAAFSDPGASASDACAGSLAVSASGSVDVNTVGDYVLVYSATDPSGNSGSQSRTVHVVDTTNPVVALVGGDMTLECHGPAFSDPGASASDACAGSLAVSVSGSVDVNTVGDYVLTYSATDPSGNSHSQSRTVHVVDTTNPVVALVGGDLTLECHGPAFSDPGASASDACAGSLAVSVSGSVDVNTVGDYVLVYSATDPSGNSHSQSRTVHVVDTTNPVVALLGGDLTLECHGPAFSDPGASASDACAGSLAVSVSGSVDVNTVGDYVLMYSATDPSGNSHSQSRTVHVVDTTNPVVALVGGDLTLECHGPAFSDPGASASDACAGSLAVSVSGSVDVNTVGDYVLTYSATDPSGNSHSQSRTVHVVDTTNPVVALLGGDLTLECHGPAFSDPGASASDACAGSLAVSVSGSVDVNTVGDYVLTYSATDPSGNSHSQSRTVHVVDTTNPVVALVGGDMTLECHGPAFSDPGASASDACAGSLPVSVSGSVDVNTVGDYVLTYSATDPSGNSHSQSRTVHVVDTTNPVVALVGGDMTLECHGPAFSDPGASASDACAGSLPVSVSGSVDVNTVGDYVLVYSATDPSGNSHSQSRTVHVVDTTNPVVALVGGDMTLECHGPAFSDPGASASDACAGSLPVSVSGSVDVNTVGDYVLVYSATDPSGNSHSQSRTVHVVDTTNPVVALVGGDMTLECHGPAFSDPGASASDACAGSLPVSVSGSVDVNTVGDYVLTYSATDPSGNSHSQSRTVHVVDTTNPVVALVGGDMTLECHGAAFSDPGASASDACAGSLTVSVSGSVDVNTVGDYVLTYSATDPSGNSHSQSRTVHVVDTTNPVVALVGGDMTLECHGPAFSDPGASASDACAGSLAVSVSGSVDVNTVGDYVLTYSATDPSGNSHSQSRTVHVVDTTNPVVALVGGDMTLECHGAAFSDPGASASDACAGSLPVSVSGSVDVNTVGDYVLTYSATDPSGNSHSQSRTVHVVDTTNPVVALVGGDMTLECHGAAFSDPGASASDACAGSLPVSVSGSVNVDTVGDYVLVYSATDPSGNSDSKSRTVHVVDTTAPVIGIPGLSASIQCPNAPVFTPPTASDACDASVQVVEVGDVTVPGACPGAYDRTKSWKAVDAQGNSSAIVSQTLTIVDTTAPVIGAPGADATISCPAAPVFTAPTASDACDANPQVIEVSDVTTPGSCASAYSRTRTWRARDCSGNLSAPVSQTINVTDSISPVAAITGPANNTVVSVGTPVTFYGVVSDNCTVQSAQWQFDSIVLAAGAIGAGGAVSTTYTFSQPGVYQVKLTAMDACGNAGTATQTPDGFDWTVIVYDPVGGFVTGGGWIHSPPGAYRPNVLLAGKANFGFVSKYQRGARVPTGETEFQFKAGGLNFHSSAYEWLVVAGAKAQYKGTGTINGTAGYAFLLTGVDGAQLGGNPPDRFRVKIWDRVTGGVVYDNKYGQAEDSDASTELGGGSIVVHSGRGGSMPAGAPNDVMPVASSALPVEFALHSAQPNPFVGSTEIGFDLPEPSQVSILVYDVRGRKVATMSSGRFDPGRHVSHWDGRADSGENLKAGIYFVRFVAHSVVSERRSESVKKLSLKQ